MPPLNPSDGLTTPRQALIVFAVWLPLVFVLYLITEILTAEKLRLPQVLRVGAGLLAFFAVMFLAATATAYLNGITP